MQQTTNNLNSARLQEAQDSFKLSLLLDGIILADELPTLSHSYDRDHDTTNLSSDTMTTQGNNRAWLEAIELANYLSSDEGEAVIRTLKTQRNTKAKRHQRKHDREATRIRKQASQTKPKYKTRQSVSLPSLRLD